MANKIKAQSTIGSVSKATESGYVNIGGVWKPVVEAYNNIGGVWKSAWESAVTYVTLELTSMNGSSFDGSDSYVLIDGVKYNAFGTYDVPLGAEMYCYVYVNTPVGTTMNYIYLDGNSNNDAVATGRGKPAEYTMTITGDIEVLYMASEIGDRFYIYTT